MLLSSPSGAWGGGPAANFFRSLKSPENVSFIDVKNVPAKIKKTLKNVAKI